jgi:hypothetical protein
MRNGLLCLSFSILLVACSAHNNDTTTGSRTFYLRNADAASKPQPTASPQASKNAMASPEPEPEPRIAPPPPSIADTAEFQTLPYEEQLSKLRAELLNRIHTLSNSQADAACLILQIIPRESVFASPREAA